MKRLRLTSIAVVVLFSFSGCASYMESDHARSILSKATAVKSPVFIQGPSISMNSVGGVSVHWGVKNLSEKKLKYVVLAVIPYNAVGDVQKCSMQHESIMRLELTGPIDEGQTKNILGDGSPWASWANVWYNSTITCAKVVYVDLTWMDGSTKRLTNPADFVDEVQPCRF